MKEESCLSYKNIIINHNTLLMELDRLPKAIPGGSRGLMPQKWWYSG